MAMTATLTQYNLFFRTPESTEQHSHHHCTLSSPHYFSCTEALNVEHNVRVTDTIPASAAWLPVKNKTIPRRY